MRVAPKRVLRPILAGTMVAAATVACSSSTEPDPSNGNSPPAGDLVLTEVASGLDSPTALASIPGDPRLFVTEQTGRVRIVSNGTILESAFLDLSDRVTTEEERGLLGIVFHPEYSQNGRFFVNYTGLDGHTRLVEYQVSADDPNLADPASETLLRLIEQPAATHNGGDLQFAPDGTLFVASGDGGGSWDPFDNGQDVTTLLGGILRLDVSIPGQVQIPPDNPFAGRPEEGAEELWAWGLRNPWRISIDHATNLLYIADVGQDQWEEVNVVPVSEPGLNYGWPLKEGPGCVDPQNCDVSNGVTDPVLYYTIAGAEECAIIGGGVYRAGRIAGVNGHYFYSDFCSGFVRSFRFEGGAAVAEKDWGVSADGLVNSMGRDASGELYLLTRDGRLLRLDPAQPD